MYVIRTISMLLCFGFALSAQAGRGRNRGSQVKPARDAASDATQVLRGSPFRTTLVKAKDVYLNMMREPDRMKWETISEQNDFGPLVQESVAQFREAVLVQLRHLKAPTVLVTTSQVKFFGTISVYMETAQQLSFAAADIELTTRRDLSLEEKRSYIPGQLERAFSFIQTWMAFAAEVEVELAEISPNVLKKAGFSADPGIRPIYLSQVGDFLAHLSWIPQSCGAHQTRHYLTQTATGGQKARRASMSYQDTLVQLLSLVKAPALQETTFSSDADMYRTRMILLTGYWKTLLLDTSEGVAAQVAETYGLLAPYWDKQPIDPNMILSAAWGAVSVGVASACYIDLGLDSPLEKNPQDMVPAQNIYQYYLQVERWVHSRLPMVQAQYDATRQDGREETFQAFGAKDDLISTPEVRWIKQALIISRMNFPTMIQAREYLHERKKGLQQAILLLDEAEREVAREELLEEEAGEQEKVRKEMQAQKQAKQALKERLQAEAYAAYCAKKQAQTAEEIQRLQERAQQEVVQAPEPAWRQAQRDAILWRYTHGNFQEGQKAFLHAWELVNQGTPGPDNLEVCLGLAEYLLAWIRHCFYDDALALVAQMEREVAHYHATKEWVSKASVLGTLERLEVAEATLGSQNVAQLLHDSLMYYRQSFAFPDFMWKQQHDIEATKENLALLMEIPQMLQQWPALLEKWKNCRKEYLKAERISKDGASTSGSFSQPLVFPTFAYLHALAPLGAEIAKLHAEKEGLRPDSATSVSPGGAVWF